MKRNPEKFASWVHEYGVMRLARALKVRRQAVQKWIGPKKAIPGRENAHKIVSISSAEPKQSGPLALEDVL